MMSTDANEADRYGPCQHHQWYHHSWAAPDLSAAKKPKKVRIPIDGYETQEIEIVTWPVTSWLECDPSTGNEGGVTKGAFEFL